MILLIVFLLMVAFWISMEIRTASYPMRLGSGLACIALVTAALVGQIIIPSYERSFHKADMRDMELCLTNGDTQAVIRALHTYNTIAATGSTYQAAREMRLCLPQPKK